MTTETKGGWVDIPSTGRAHYFHPECLCHGSDLPLSFCRQVEGEVGELRAIEEVSLSPCARCLRKSVFHSRLGTHPNSRRK
jgi:hypothetical protein